MKRILRLATLLAALSAPGAGAHEQVRVVWGPAGSVALDGSWAFAVDPGEVGESEGWHENPRLWSGWEGIHVPSSWETAGFADHDGAAWYARTMIVEGRPDAPRVGLKFTGVSGAAMVWANGELIHESPAATSFLADVTAHLEASDTLHLAVRIEDRGSRSGLTDAVLLVGLDEAPEEGVMAAPDLVAIANEVAMEVEELRGWNFKEVVHKEVYSEDQLREFVERKLFEEEYPGDELLHLQAFLTMVGMIPRDTPLRETILDVLLNQIGGFYDPETRAFYMVEREGVDFGPAMERILIAHELTHALDDQHLDLQALIDAREHTEDNEFAIGSVIEGSATTLMTRYMTRMQIEGRLDMSEMMGLVESERKRSEVFLDAPLYFRTLLARYSLGMRFLLKGKLTAVLDPDAGALVGENLKAAVKNPPRSSEQVLHVEKYWEEPDEPVLADDEAMRALLSRAGFRVAAVNTAGEIGAGIVTTPANAPLSITAMASPEGWTNAASTGWGGDRFYLLEPEVLERGAREGTYRGVWLTMWDTPGDRNEFVNAYQATVADPDRRAVTLGDRATAFLYGMTPAEAGKVEAVLTGGPLRFTRDGSPWE